jgi:hypothetical protein
MFCTQTFDSTKLRSPTQYTEYRQPVSSMESSSQNIVHIFSRKKQKQNEKKI